MYARKHACTNARAHTHTHTQVLAWLSILASKNAGVPEGGKLVGVKDVALEHWNKFGRNFFRCEDASQLPE